MTNVFYPFKLPQIMGFVHNTIRQYLLWPLVGKIERGWVSAHSILPRPIKVNDKCTALGCIVENIRVPQVPEGDIFVGEEDALPDGHAPE